MVLAVFLRHFQAADTLAAQGLEPVRGGGTIIIIRNTSILGANVIDVKVGRVPGQPSFLPVLAMLTVPWRTPLTERRESASRRTSAARPRTAMISRQWSGSR